MNINIENSLSFTGHRPNKLYGYSPYVEENKRIIMILRDIIESQIINNQIDTFITGMALGIDQWAGRVVLRLKEKYPHIKLVAAIPCANHSAKWNRESQEQWQYIIDRCDYVHHVSLEPYTHWCMQKRNEWMVDNSGIVLAVHDGSKGGTGNCVNYAKKKNKDIITINPKTFEVS